MRTHDLLYRAPILVAGALAAAPATAAVAGARGGAPTARAAAPAKVQLASTTSGRILVDGSSGFTLYEFTKDSRNKDACVKVSGCVALWPPLTSSGKPRAGAGVRASLLSTIRLPSGARQVTYAGHPLYTYPADGAPAQTSYIGADQFGGRWYALNAAGHAVKH
jgi:predicted lipoprotein with Yx(FWY)xxD motif